MRYNKPAVSIEDQIKTLKERGLKFPDEVKAANYLSNISYYRLRAYTYPFQDNASPEHPFTTEVSFDNIIDLCVFDRKLRLLIFDAIEKIEIALRTKIIYEYAMVHGAFWHTDPSLYIDGVRFATHLTSLQNEIDRSAETFISHYKKKYTSPQMPPCWMALEVSSMGLLSKIFKNLKRSPEKKKIARQFGLPDIKILENWMLCLCTLRNICAHHGRVWNRRLVKISMPYNTTNDYLKDTNIYPNKLYASLAAVQYIMNIISPGSDFKNRLKSIMTNCPLKQEKEMGFPKRWDNDPFWK